MANRVVTIGLWLASGLSVAVFVALVLVWNRYPVREEKELIHKTVQPMQARHEEAVQLTQRITVQQHEAPDSNHATTSTQNVSLLFVGDMMFDRTVATRIRASKSPMYAFEKIQGAEGRFFRGYDAVIGNLEGPVTTKRALPEKEIDFAFDPSVLSAIKRVGFDALSQANNHQLDQGRAGADTSRKAITDAGLTAFGDEVHEDATSSLAFIERRGQRIALIGFNTTDNPLDEAAAKATIVTAKTHADRVIIFMHWGEEYHDTPNATQKALAHEFIDEGVDAVIGSHPHWMQSVEVYRGKVIAYSLGNFIFDQDWSAETREGLAVSLSLSPSGSRLALFPIRIEKSQPMLLTGADRQKRLEKLASISDAPLKDQISEGEIRIID